MKRISYGVLVGSFVLGCTSAPTNDDDVSRSQEKLDVGSISTLTRKQGTALSNISAEQNRQLDTNDPNPLNSSYYTANEANYHSGNIVSVLSDLSSFISRYQFGGPDEVTATYYNRGDLGIGREMHCVDHSRDGSSGELSGEVACYVRNFAAGDDNSEFTFGLSTDIAFQNVAGNHPFATVAMVFRKQAVGRSDESKVLFMVYNDQGTALLNAAALDRAGITFAVAFNGGASLTGLGTPGQNFNNHIPSNCATCHGGSYNSSTHRVDGSLFLPFDLDQFDFDATHTRAGQEGVFRQLNQMVRNVAENSGNNPNNVLSDQIDGWYHNTAHTTTATGSFDLSGSFDSSYLPAGWDSTQTSASVDAANLYRDVVRPSCRGCHLVNSIPFDSEADFVDFASLAVGRITAYQMPQSLQAIRNFWQSDQPSSLENYLRANGLGTEANSLHAGGPGDVATLDPPLIFALGASN